MSRLSLTLILHKPFGSIEIVFSLASCEDLGIHVKVQNTTANVHFDSNDILKADREILCPSTSDWVPVKGCLHSCENLIYGEVYELLVKGTFSETETFTCGTDIVTGRLILSSKYSKNVNWL